MRSHATASGRGVSDESPSTVALLPGAKGSGEREGRGDGGFAVGGIRMSSAHDGRKRGRAHLLRTTSHASLALLALLATTPSEAQQPGSTELPRVTVTAPPPTGRSKAGRPKQAVRPPAAPATPDTTTAPLVTTPLNTGAVAGSASRLGLPVLQTPASVEIVSQETMKEQGYRTTTETAAGAVGVLAGDAAGAPAGFQMRGFSFGQVNVLYNGISTGPSAPSP